MQNNLFQEVSGGANPTPPLQVAHQKIIRDKMALVKDGGLFGDWHKDIKVDIKKSIVRRVSFSTAEKIILDYEWLGNMAQRTTDTFGIFFGDSCGGVVCFSIPPTPQAAMGVCGKENANLVKTLSRGACVHWAHPHSASKLISMAIKIMVKETKFRIFIAYSDERAGEIGTVYQATNWLYTGKTAGDIEYLFEGRWISGRSSRHKSYKKRGIDFGKLEKRIAIGKHRYVKICDDEIAKSLRYKIFDYPKRNFGVGI